MARVIASKIQTIINTSLTAAQITTHIEVASNLVDDVLSDKGMTSARLADIELYLAAHFVSIRAGDGGQVTKYKVGDTEIEYGGNFSEALKTTSYGQQAISLDTSGTLASLGKKRATFGAFGHVPP